MALNYSHRPLVSAHVSEDNFVSPMRIVNGCLVEGIPEKNGEGYSRPRHTSLGEIEDQNSFFSIDRVDRYSSPESTSRDTVDLLPSDPFGMDIKTTFTAFTGWLEDLEVNYGGGCQKDSGLFTQWNSIWNNALKSQTFPSNAHFGEKLNAGIGSFQSNVQANEKSHMGITHSIPDGVSIDEKPNSASTSCCSDVQSREKVAFAADFEHEPLSFPLSFLGVKDLLSVERVCRSLCSIVRGDPLLWKRIFIDHPLNDRITDNVLVQLVRRAQGNLECLTLIECPKVTDDGMRHILETNPRLTKLSVPGCTRLSIESMVKNLKAYNTNTDKNTRGINSLRIGGFFGVTREHFEELKFLLGSNRETSHKPHFYHRGNLYLPCDDDRAIDIDMCPRCEKFRLVYDCPAEGCRVKDHSVQACRACILCIARCAQCGRCINDTEYEETFCLELLCSDCCKKMPKYQDKMDKIEPSGGALIEPGYSNLSLNG